ncbi:MAG: hypothetical protein EU539_10015 [Promethearchaeota archaeon]|nr:MAG: hypothetical protein EU539_10015 [Candidatus Lokiarchaeota archaeon]
MRRTKKSFVVGIVIIVVIVMSFVNFNALDASEKETMKKEETTNDEGLKNPLHQPKISSERNYDNIEQLFTTKVNQFENLGYFSQVHEPSLQATYFALYTLEATGKLDEIDDSSMISYIMSHYNESAHAFVDAYAIRYLDADLTYFSKMDDYISMLEINCQAILSLDILNRLDLIDVQQSINFIESCYNPETGGYIGQPYTPELHSFFRVATADNTYHAILTLEKLGASPGNVNEVVNFLNNLQSPGTGGFYNNFMEDTPLNYHKANLLSSYYCIQGLKMLGFEQSIQMDEFRQFLDNIYNGIDAFFVMSKNNFHSSLNYTSTVATALGLYLSEVSGYSGMDRNGVINFILNNRNSWGIWNNAREFHYHELIESFQVIRALHESGQISILSPSEKSQIASALEYYKQSDGGYSLLSMDYTSLNLIYSVVNSFELYDRLSDLDPQMLFELIESCYFSTSNTHSFVGCKGMIAHHDLGFQAGFRSQPIEYYRNSRKELFFGTGELYSHEYTYYALDSLREIHKLHEFKNHHDLHEVLNDIIASQFIDINAINSGGFLPSLKHDHLDATFKDRKIFLENSYFAVKCLEILVGALNLNTINHLAFNREEFYHYLKQNLVQTDSTIHYDPEFPCSTEDIIQNTYYIIYILKALNLYDLDKSKIRNYLHQNLNYSNLKNVYYSFKISKMIGISLDFDLEMTSNLVQDLYSPEFCDFYQDTKSRTINQEIFLWVCDMAMNDHFQIDCQHPSTIYLGSILTIKVSFSNLIFINHTHDLDVNLQWSTTYPLVAQVDGTYVVIFRVPIRFDLTPFFNGILTVNYRDRVFYEKSISIRTTYDLNKNGNITQDHNKINFKYNISYRFCYGPEFVSKARVYANISRNGTFLESKNFTLHHFAEYSLFNLTYECVENASYEFHIFLEDLFHPNGMLLEEYTPPGEDIPQVEKDEEDSKSDGDERDQENPFEIYIDLFLFLLGIFLILSSSLLIYRKVRPRLKTFFRQQKMDKVVTNPHDQQEMTPQPSRCIGNNTNFFFEENEEQVLMNHKDQGNPKLDSIHSIQSSGQANYDLPSQKRKSKTSFISKQKIFKMINENKREIAWTSLVILLFVPLFFFKIILIPGYLIIGSIMAVLGTYKFIKSWLSDDTKKGKFILSLGLILVFLGCLLIMLELSISLSNLFFS